MNLKFSQNENEPLAYVIPDWNTSHSHLSRACIYPGYFEDYETNAFLMGKLMGHGSYGRRLMEIVKTNFHVDAPLGTNDTPLVNSRDNHVDLWISKLDLTLLPKSMEIVEHYPEALFRRSHYKAKDVSDRFHESIFGNCSGSDFFNFYAPVIPRDK